ncbi:bifunctional adenosylcobinamide kinase/adenosylcobinamide-phosphate guanylyltransferase [Pinibacter aurantiacus]|uniref:Bifunctional adenosylcobinamide kinase/adenosylcobinamide-phosphate guanylyltransferase n=1 Tax=Pinibacter aurantiacus TaxID=2851599 RepID=A0A9E2W537_9BACT|nr:bifunctional adenosylcobinamide kinase/adenosylcobinamide-phosphate guanylyltransferase [Pinibacter aurantiacus]MBV4358233.1 bifunctional adenosylcobinamide kinase/adenosylcobinamide-phosphate guanylyltransferase [Pinibacter aurantiacus]
MIYFITGGARSGKSSYAQKEALSLSDNPVYVATANVMDAEFEQRVTRHKADRDERWTALEEPMHVSKLPIADRVVVVDCVTLWLTNFFLKYEQDIHASLDALKKEIDELDNHPGTFFIVSNEIGMGLHADTEMGRKFVDLQGWANQYIAAKAKKAVFMVAGIPVFVKS